MNRRIAAVGLFALIGIITLLSGCAPAVIAVRPPEPRVEVYGTPPYADAVWVPGYWAHRRGHWDWVPGHWASPPRPRSVWVPGHWEERRRGWVWVPGHWQHR